MSLPNLPTDNLYKFMALSGIGVILFSIGFAWIQYRSVTEELYALDAELSMHGVNETQMQVEVDQLEHAVKEYFTPNSPGLPKDVDTTLSKIYTVVQARALLAAKTRRINSLASQLQVIYACASIGILAGLVLAFAGFRLWYSRLQVFQDQIVESQARKNSA